MRYQAALRPDNLYRLYRESEWVDAEKGAEVSGEGSWLPSDSQTGAVRLAGSRTALRLFPPLGLAFPTLFDATIDRVHGGYSSAAERLTVAQDVVGSIPTSRPK